MLNLHAIMYTVRRLCITLDRAMLSMEEHWILKYLWLCNSIRELSYYFFYSGLFLCKMMRDIDTGS